MKALVGIAIALFAPVGFADTVTYNTNQNGVDVKWASVQSETGTMQVFTIDDGTETDVQATFSFSNPTDVSWTGTINGGSAAGKVLIAYGGTGTTYSVTLLSATETLASFTISGSLLTNMVPEFGSSLHTSTVPKCVCWPARKGNSSCSNADCDNSKDCNTLGSICTWRDIAIVTGVMQ